LNITVLALFFIAMGGCDDFLTQPPKDTMTDETYWTNENNVRSFAWGFYTGYFQGYGSGFAWGDYFSGQSLMMILPLLHLRTLFKMCQHPVAVGPFPGFERQMSLLIELKKCLWSKKLSNIGQVLAGFSVPWSTTI